MKISVRDLARQCPPCLSVSYSPVSLLLSAYFLARCQRRIFGKEEGENRRKWIGMDGDGDGYGYGYGEGEGEWEGEEKGKGKGKGYGDGRCT